MRHPNAQTGCSETAALRVDVQRKNTKHPKRGSALLLVLVTIILLSTMVISLVYRMRLEGELASRYRFRMKAHSYAQAGLEWSKLLLIKSINPGGEDEETAYGEAFRIQTLNLSRGLSLDRIEQEIGDGTFTITLQPEQGRRNVNKLTRLDWEEIFESTNVPEEYVDELIGAFEDWIDSNDSAHLHGAESDDSYYRDQDYEVKNAPIDTIDELLLIKGFVPEIVYGGILDKEGDAIQVSGIAPLLTVYGDGKVNINTASAAVMATLPELTEDFIERILEERNGLDGEPGTEDDGFRSVEQALAQAGGNAAMGSRLTTTERRYIRVTSIGESGETKAGIWCIFEQKGKELLPIFFREEEVP